MKVTFGPLWAALLRRMANTANRREIIAQQARAADAIQIDCTRPPERPSASGGWDEAIARVNAERGLPTGAGRS